MSDTMMSMEYMLADVLNSDQLMPDDLIKIDDEIVQVINIDSLKDGYVLTYKNDFGETDIIEIDDYQKFELYVLIDE